MQLYNLSALIERLLPNQMTWFVQAIYIHCEKVKSSPFSLSRIREIIIIIIILCVYILYWAGVRLVFRPGRGQYAKGA